MLLVFTEVVAVMTRYIDTVRGVQQLIAVKRPECYRILQYNAYIFVIRTSSACGMPTSVFRNNMQPVELGPYNKYIYIFFLRNAISECKLSGIYI